MIISSLGLCTCLLPAMSRALQAFQTRSEANDFLWFAPRALSLKGSLFYRKWHMAIKWQILRPLFNTNTPGICIEKWSWNFYLGTPSAIFGTPQGPYFKDLLETVHFHICFQCDSLFSSNMPFLVKPLHISNVYLQKCF